MGLEPDIDMAAGPADLPFDPPGDPGDGEARDEEDRGGLAHRRVGEMLGEGPGGEVDEADRG